MTAKKYGDRQTVWDGLAQKTRGGLTKYDILISREHIVSKKKSNAARESYKKFGFNKRVEEADETPAAPKRKRRRKKKSEL